MLQRTRPPASAEQQPSEDAAKARQPDFARQIDAFILSMAARAGGGLSPATFATAAFDWGLHFAMTPGRQAKTAMELTHAFSNAWAETVLGATTKEKSDADAPWRRGLPALRRLAESLEAVAESSVDDVSSVSRRHRDLLRFQLRQIFAAAHPDNYLWTNEAAIDRTIAERGANLARGARALHEDMLAAAGVKPADRDGAFVVGDTLAATTGRVVYRNRLIELIQYAPTTEKTRSEPVLITPAWIMKYYILDLSAHNSLVRYLCDHGFTVFMISWRNPGREDAALSFDDYRRLGVLAALEAVGALLPDRRVHAVGYCLGGTLLAIAAAALARDGDRTLASLTLLAAQTDFRDPGELALFITEDQLDMLDASMEAQGYLAAEQMAGAFQMLRSRDLVWRRAQRSYLLGEETPAFDLMVWNADATRMPYRMHSEYLRKLFLDNDFVQGRFRVDGRPVAVSDIRAPIFALGTERDHVAPWRSVYKINLFADTDVTFALANGGHNAGVVSEPGHAGRRHRIRGKADSDHYVDPDAWFETTAPREGSWWPSWVEWLAARSGAAVEAPRPARAPLASNLVEEGADLPPAPGDYVRMR